MKDEHEMTLYNAVAHVFEIDHSKQQWVPKAESTIPIAFVVSRKASVRGEDFDYGDKVLKLVAAERGHVLLESIITPNMVFNRRSDKFGQWVDQREDTVYGLGFNSETEIEDFCKTFKQLQNNYLLNQPDEDTRSIYSQQAVNRAPSTTSTTNITSKCLQTENAALRTNNLKLTQALQDSKANVSAWEKELSGLRKENAELRIKLATIETNNRIQQEQEEQNANDANDTNDAIDRSQIKTTLEQLHDKLESKLLEIEDVKKNLFDVVQQL